MYKFIFVFVVIENSRIEINLYQFKINKWDKLCSKLERII